MDFIDAFLKSRNFKSETTEFYYRSVLTKIVSIFGDNLEKLSVTELNEYLYGDFRNFSFSKNGKVVNKKYAATTLEKNIDIVRSFLNFLFHNELVNIDFASTIHSTTQDRNITRNELPSVDEIEALIKHIDEMYLSNKDYFSLRNQVLFNLIFHSGLTTNELSSLKDVRPVLYGDSFELVITKPSHRLVHINKSDAILITRLISLKKAIVLEGGPLFISSKHKTGLSRRSIGFIINNLCKSANIEEYSAESFRKAGMLAALSIGYDLGNLAHDLNIREEYMKRRMKYSLTSEKVKSYADLFERRE